MKYKFRNLPCSICESTLWGVQGHFQEKDSKTGGVLEWCYDKEDAEATMSLMQKDPRFSNLSVFRQYVSGDDQLFHLSHKCENLWEKLKELKFLNFCDSFKNRSLTKKTFYCGSAQ